MKISPLSARSRERLDQRFESMRPVAGIEPPVRGWIKAIREAIGMSSAQLAGRLGVTQPTVTEIEQSEVKGTIQLNTLRRAAEAMNCTLVYTLVPKAPLETMVQERAREVVRRRLRSVEHSMALEDQAVPSKEFEKRIDALAREVRARELWKEK
ncbi:MAG: mobile mystery protein A [Bdellovibrionota bacterium]